MFKRSKYTTLIVVIVLTFVFSVALFADNNKKEKKGKVSPALTVHEIHLGRVHFFSGTTSPVAPGAVLYSIQPTINTIWRAGIQIPSNATITGLTMRAKMNFNATNDSEKLIAYIYRINDYGSRIMVTLVKSNYNAGNTDFRTKSRTVSIGVPNQPLEVWVNHPPTDTVAAGNYEVSWVRVTYTTP